MGMERRRQKWGGGVITDGVEGRVERREKWGGRKVESGRKAW